MSVFPEQQPAQNGGKGIGTGVIIGIVIAVAVAVGMVALVIGGGIVLFHFGSEMVAEQVRRDIQDNPVIKAQIGTIEEIDVDFTASASEPGSNVFVFHLEGTRGRGVLTANTVTVDEYTGKVTWGKLQAESGESYDLFPDQGPKPR